MADLNDIIEKGVTFLENQQLSYGEFRTLIGPGKVFEPEQYVWMKQADLVNDSSPFATTFIVHALDQLRDPRCQSMVNKSLSFLQEQMEPGGVWRYYSSRQFKHYRIPPDLDDTACASFCLLKHGIEIPENHWIFTHNQDSKGLFRTWIYPRSFSRAGLKLWWLRFKHDWVKRVKIPKVPDKFIGDPRFAARTDPTPRNDVDPFVNANVLLYLGENAQTKPAINYILDIIRNSHETETNLYYTDSLILFYVVARAYDHGIPTLGEVGELISQRIQARQGADGSISGSAFLTALGMCALLSFDPECEAVIKAMAYLQKVQAEDGSWPIYGFCEVPGECWGSPELTTAICLQALATWQARYAELEAINNFPSPVHIDEKINLFTDDVRRDPYRYLQALQEQQPVYYSSVANIWFVSRHEDVTSAARNFEEFSSSVMVKVDRILIGADPPEHTRVRRLISPSFTAAKINELAPSIRKIANTLMDHLNVQGECDLVADIASPLPVEVAMEMLDVPPESFKSMKRWIYALIEATMRDTDPVTQERLRPDLEELDEFCHRYARDCRAGKVDSVISAMIKNSSSEEDQLTEAELSGFTKTVLTAAYKTTFGLLSNMFYMLLIRPDLMTLVRNNSDYHEVFIEESLRFDAPLQNIKRRTVNAIEINDVLIPAESEVWLMLSSANRDPALYAAPDLFRLDRKKRRHLAFGMGPHTCLGLHLARLEARITLEEILPRLKNLRPRNTWISYGLSESLELRAPNRLDVLFEPE